MMILVMMLANLLYLEKGWKQLPLFLPYRREYGDFITNKYNNVCYFMTVVLMPLLTPPQCGQQQRAAGEAFPQTPPAACLVLIMMAINRKCE